MSYAFTTISGIVSKDAECTDSYARFSIPVTYTNKDGKDYTTWYNCVGFGGLVDVLKKNAVKGRILSLRARYTEDEYEKDGEKRKSTSFVVEEILEFGQILKK